MEIKEFYAQLHRTAEQAGIKILSDEKCCQLLAWLLWFGGGREAVCFDLKLNTDIGIAQDRLNLHGGERANAELLPTLKLYSKDAELACSGEIPKSQWIVDLEEYYGITKSQKNDSRTKNR
jgi:hypothetical protein